MSLPAMRFKNFSWPKNPHKLQISSQREIKEFFLPFLHSSFQDFGAKRRKISGEGVFLGPQAAEQFQQLSSLLAEGGSGVLALPALPPLSAALVRLDLLADPSPNAVRYSFEFLEDSCASSALPADLDRPCYLAAPGENVWEIANRFHTSYATLLTLNPQLQWPNYFLTQERVVLP